MRFSRSLSDDFISNNVRGGDIVREMKFWPRSKASRANLEKSCLMCCILWLFFITYKVWVFFRNGSIRTSLCNFVGSHLIFQLVSVNCKRQSNETSHAKKYSPSLKLQNFLIKLGLWFIFQIQANNQNQWCNALNTR